MELDVGAPRYPNTKTVATRCARGIASLKCRHGNRKLWEAAWLARRAVTMGPAFPPVFTSAAHA